LEIFICRIDDINLEGSTVSDNIYGLISRLIDQGQPFKVIYDKYSAPNSEIDAHERLKKSNADILFYGISAENNLIWDTDLKYVLRAGYNQSSDLVSTCDMNRNTINSTFDDLKHNELNINNLSFDKWLLAIHNFGQNKYASAKAYLDLYGELELKCASKQDSANIYITKGNALLNLRKSNEAVIYFEKSLEIYPFEERGHRVLACAYADQGRNQESIDQYSKLIQENPTDETLYVSRANIYTNSASPKKALSDLNKAIDLNPNSAKIMNAFGRHHFINGEISKAFEYCQSAIEVDPNNPKTYSILGVFYHDTNDYNKARQYYLTGIKNGATDEATFKNLINVDRTFAIEGYTELLRMFPNSTKYLQARAYAYLTNNQLEEAFTDLDKALSEEPNNARSNYLIYQVYEKSGEYKQGLPYLSKAEKIDPTMINYHAIIANAERDYNRKVRS